MLHVLSLYVCVCVCVVPFSDLEGCHSQVSHCTCKFYIQRVTEIKTIILVVVTWMCVGV